MKGFDYYLDMGKLFQALIHDGYYVVVDSKYPNLIQKYFLQRIDSLDSTFVIVEIVFVESTVVAAAAEIVIAVAAVAVVAVVENADVECYDVECYDEFVAAAIVLYCYAEEVAKFD